ncbi:hypothetical protein [Nitrosomonas communis]|uniref:hypothetical protein n=1 Tax=Nitrosomonas communis TaxID=44574 RepID=UPI0026EAF5D7|nr:hypothetical protein [Nitrosomonas communis]MCO6428471.1 hypothetical protein [Nitrosomonas communis]
MTALCSSQRHCPRSALLLHSEALKTRFQVHPPHTVAEAVYEINKLTGMQLALNACRDFMHKHLGMKYRKMAVIPSKADPDKQSEFLHNKLEQVKRLLKPNFQLLPKSANMTT